MLEALKRLGQSRKAIVSGAAIITAAVLLFLGRISADQFVGLIAVVAPTLVGATALEDAAAKYAAAPPSPVSPTSAPAEAPSRADTVTTPTPDPTGPEKKPLRPGERYPVFRRRRGQAHTSTYYALALGRRRLLPRTEWAAAVSSFIVTPSFWGLG